MVRRRPSDPTDTSTRRAPTGLRLALAAAVVLVMATGAYVMWLRPDDAAAQARAYAEQSASALAAGKVPPTADEGAGPAQTDLDKTLQGMGSIPHAVVVRDVTLEEGERSGSITFEHTWTVHQDKSPWRYRTTMPITRTGDAWRGAWSSTVLAPDLSSGEHLSATRLNPPRGEVLGNEGGVLVTERPVRRIGINRPDISSEQATESARRLAALVGIDQESYVKAVAGAGPQAFVEAIAYRDHTDDLAKVADALAGIPGAASISDSRQLAPSSGFAAPILGRVGEATAEIVEKSGGTVRAGQVVGLSGLQAAQEERLAGSPGFVIQARGADRPARTLFKVDAQAGKSVTTTLDVPLQELAEFALRGVTPASALVAIRPSDGHVLAAASGPGSTGQNTALLGQYAPGSTFKAVTALALLRAGLTPDQKVDCTATATVDGRSFKNYDNYPSSRLGSISLRDAFANSCNTALIATRDKLAPDALPSAAEALDLTVKPALGVPAFLGSVPSANGETDLAASEIGQGRVLASPLGMATVAAGIAAGHPVRPVLVTDPATPAPDQAARSPLTRPEGEQLRSLMRAVVTQGSAPFLQQVPGQPVMAKTGTAEYGSESPPRTHAWMIGIQGDLAVAVFVEDGAGGAHTAGPILRTFLTSAATEPR